MAQTQKFEIGSYPLPDPTWDYATLWDWLHKANNDLKSLIQYTAQIEEATPETDKAIGIQLEAIAKQIKPLPIDAILFALQLSEIRLRLRVRLIPCCQGRRLTLRG